MLIKGSIENIYIGCGEINASDRIVNGNKAKHNSIPWQVALVLKGKEKPFCGGTIICSKFIMTAAHCIDKDKKGLTSNLFMMPGEFQIVAGEYDWTVYSSQFLSAPKNLHASWHDIKNIAVHPKYGGLGPKFDYDYAIIELIEPIKLTGDSKARAACLPDPTTDIDYPDGTKFVVGGWGPLAGNYGDPYRKLHNVTVHAISDAKCDTKHEFKAHFSERMHCVGNLQNGAVYDTCHGDSGGKAQKKLII